MCVYINATYVISGYKRRVRVPVCVRTAKHTLKNTKTKQNYETKVNVAE